jgi:hypothetical protein
LTSYVKLKIVLTLSIALILAFTVYSVLGSYQTETQVVVANMDIPERTQIKPEMLRIERVRQKERAQLAPNSVEDMDFIVGSLALVPIPKDKPINTFVDVVPLDESKLAKDMQGKPIVSSDISESYVLERGERLIGISLGIESTLYNRFAKGDLIDLTGTYERDEVTYTVLLAQGKTVHRVPDRSGSNYEYGQDEVVVLKVTPKEALDIINLRSFGKIEAILSSARAEVIPREDRNVDLAKVQTNIRTRDMD